MAGVVNPGPGRRSSGTSTDCSKNDTANITGTVINNPIKISGSNCGTSAILSTLVTLLLIVAILISSLMLIWGGVQYILSGGDQKGVSAARGRILYSVVGLAVSMFALIAMKILGGVFGFSLF